MANPANKHAQLSILLVEDSAADALITTKIIERFRPDHTNVRITHITRLRDAQEALQGKAFDCVLMDLHLPDGRGSSNITTIRRHAPDLPVVVLSGSFEGDMEPDALARGAAACFVKRPVSMAENLYAAIGKAIDSAIPSTSVS